MKTEIKSFSHTDKRIKIENGVRYIKIGKFWTLAGIVKTYDQFHNYSSKQLTTI